MIMEWEEGQKVRATRRITEGGICHSGSVDAKFGELGYIHAEKGDLGVVVGHSGVCPTVQFSPKGTLTIVNGKPGVEVASVSEEEPSLANERIGSDLWADYTQAERESAVDTFLGLLRKYLVEPDAVISMSQTHPTCTGRFGDLRFTGAVEMSITVSGRLKPFCNQCGNMGSVSQVDGQGSRKWVACSLCEIGCKKAEQKGAE